MASYLKLNWIAPTDAHKKTEALPLKENLQGSNVQTPLLP